MPYRRLQARTKQQIDLARTARQKPSVVEDIVWEVVRNRKLGFKFKREVPFGPYRTDFFCDEAKLALEMDGEQHDPVLDAIRDKYFADQGVVTFRIPNVEFFGLDPSAPYRDHLEEMIQLCEQRAGRPRFDCPHPQPLSHVHKSDHGNSELNFLGFVKTGEGSFDCSLEGKGEGKTG